MNVVVAIDFDSNDKLKSCQWPTVYACDIADAVGDNVVQFSHVEVAGVIDEWPESFEQLKPY